QKEPPRKRAERVVARRSTSRNEAWRSSLCPAPTGISIALAGSHPPQRRSNMTTRKAAPKKTKKLAVRKETLHDLDAAKSGVKGGGVTGRCMPGTKFCRTFGCGLTDACRRSG